MKNNKIEETEKKVASIDQEAIISDFCDSMNDEKLTERGFGDGKKEYRAYSQEDRQRLRGSGKDQKTYQKGRGIFGCVRFDRIFIRVVYSGLAVLFRQTFRRRKGKFGRYSTSYLFCVCGDDFDL